MNRKMYCLYDYATNNYMNPLVFVNDGEAIRWMTTVVNSKEESNVSLYPHQFRLVYLGSFDDQSGKFTNEQMDVLEATSVQEERVRYSIRELMEELDKRYGMQPVRGNGNAQRDAVRHVESSDDGGPEGVV